MALTVDVSGSAILAGEATSPLSPPPAAVQTWTSATSGTNATTMPMCVGTVVAAREFQDHLPWTWAMPMSVPAEASAPSVSHRGRARLRAAVIRAADEPAGSAAAAARKTLESKAETRRSRIELCLDSGKAERALSLTSVLHQYT